MKNCMKAIAVAAAAVFTASSAVAADTVRVTDSSGAAVDYGSLEDAVAACKGGETLRFTGTPAVRSAHFAVPVSMTIDMGGYTWEFAEKTGIELGSNIHLVLTNGTFRGTDSALRSDGTSGTVVDLRDCSFYCHCLTWGTARINTYDGFFLKSAILVSPWKEGTMNIYGGKFYVTKDRPEGYGDRGTSVTVHGGHFSLVPHDTRYTRFALADGLVAVCSNVTEEIDGKTFKYNYHVKSFAETDPVAWISSGVYAENISDAFVSGVTGSVVTLLRDFTFTGISRADIRRNAVFDLGGHTLTGSTEQNVINVCEGFSAVISNGTVRAVNGKSCVVANHRVNVTLGKGLTLYGRSDQGWRACVGVYFPGTNSTHVVMDGTVADCAALHSIHAPASGVARENCSFVVRGDSAAVTAKFKANDAQDDSIVRAEGGSWELDPADYVKTGYVKLYRQAASPCKWQVRLWDGTWVFRPGDETPVVTGTCEGPAGPVTVVCDGDIPERSVQVADFSGVTFLTGGDGLSFRAGGGNARRLGLGFSGGVLCAWRSGGLKLSVK